jgi:uncharacterized membrane protein YeaQ/YmgE (transglycosylase-associated protein family)
MRFRARNYLSLYFLGILLTSLEIFVNTWARSFGLTSINPELVFGSLMTGSLSPNANRIGILFHIVLGGFLALVYARVFNQFRQNGWRMGAKLAIFQWLLVGASLRFFPFLEKYFPRYLRPPGIFWSQEGSVTPILTFIEYCFFGILVGLVHQAMIGRAFRIQSQFESKKLIEQQRAA